MDYVVSDEELRRIPGCTPLKIYIVLNNSPNGATAAMLANQLQTPVSTMYRTLPKLSKMGILSKNGTIFYHNREKILTFDKEKEKNQKKKENPKVNIPSSSSLSIEEVIEKIFDWFFADADYLKRLCDMFEIPCAETGDMQKIKEGLEPYVKSFARFLRMKKTDLETKGAEDTKEHFTKWMQKGNYQRIARALERAAEKKERESVLNSPPDTQRTLPLRQGEYPKGEGVDYPLRWRSYPRGQAQQLTEEQQAEQMLQKRRRMEKAEEQQRHLDEIQRAADGSTDTTARDRIFARLGLNKTKGSG